MVRIISLDLLEIKRSLKSLKNLFRGSLKWLETSQRGSLKYLKTSLHAGMPAHLQSKEPTQHTSLMITDHDVLSSSAKISLKITDLQCDADRWSPFIKNNRVVIVVLY